MPRKAKTTEVDIKIKKPRVRKSVKGSGAYKIHGVKGKGDFKSFFKNAYNVAKNIIPKGSAAMLGSTLGGPAGGIVGDIISKITGMGSYSHNSAEITHNALFKGVGEGDALQIPRFSPGKHGVQVAHCEYIGDIVCGTGTPSVFTLQSYAINPGLATTFPWLSQIAENFETYRFHGLVFEQKSLVTDNNATFGSLGSLIQCASYNAANSNFVNKFQMENYEGSVSSKPSVSQLFGIECDPRDIPENHLYIRSGAVPSGQDQKTYDMANYQVATVGMPVASQTISETWVSYLCDLMSAKLYSGQFGYNLSYYHAYNATGISTSAYMGTLVDIVASSNNTLPLTIGLTTITFPANIITGNYCLLYTCNGTGGSPASPTITLTSGASALNVLNNNANDTLVISGSGIWCKPLFFTITAPSAVLTFSVGTFPSSVTNVDLIVMQVNGLAN